MRQTADAKRDFRRSSAESKRAAVERLPRNVTLTAWLGADFAFMLVGLTFDMRGD
jgi:hypothetical protein